MKCERSVDVVAFVKGELEDSHFTSCAICTEEAERTRGLLARLASLSVDPSPDFPRRVTRAFAAAHPELVESRSRFRLVPAWAVSVAAHAAVLAIAAIIFLAPPPVPTEPEESAYRTIPRPGPEPTPTIDPEPDPRLRTDEIKLWNGRKEVLADFDARTNGPKKSELRFEGSEKPVRSALAWLAKQQETGGSWDPEKSGGDREYTVGITGLVLLSFLGDGHTHKSGDHTGAVGRGLHYLMERQQASGAIGAGMYNHALASLALLEAYVMTRDESLAVPVGAAISYTVSAQDAGGGWGYTARASDTDTSISGWLVFTLRLAFARGDKTVVPALNLAKHRLRRMTSEDGRVGYRNAGQFPNGAEALTAVGMLATEMCSPLPDPEVLDKQTRVLLAADPLRSGNDLYFAYFATLSLFQRGGDGWSQWSGRVVPALMKSQNSDGSWPKYYDKWAHYGGQLYTTAMGALILESPYRYPRLNG